MSARAPVLLAALLAATPPARLATQEIRVAAWAGYENVTDRDDWSVVGGQVTLGTARGNRGWIAAERHDRFGAQDATVRLGSLFRPGERWWLSAEWARGLGPEFVPEDAWELDVSTLVAPRLGAGLAYRRQNYAAGAVDAVIPHLHLDAGRTSGELRVFVARNPADRTDVAVFGRLTVPIGRRGLGWLGAGAGRESYLVGTGPAQAVQSLETVTVLAGGRYEAGGRTAVRAEVVVVKSEPVLSRRGVSLGIERAF